MTKKHQSIIKTLNEISEKQKINKMELYLDYIVTKIKYHASIEDYEIFEMYNLNNSQKKTIITTGINNKLKKLNIKNVPYFNDRSLFYKRYRRYLRRDYIELEGDNYESFRKFVDDKSTIVVKTKNNNVNALTEIIEVRNHNLYNLYTRLLEEKKTIVESVISKNEILSSLNPLSYNSINIITLYDKIVCAYLVIGNDKATNYFLEDALVAPINIETGIVDYFAADKNNKAYEKTPSTSEGILWFTIPKWPRIKRFVENLSKESAPNYISWNITLNEKDPVILSATDRPSNRFYQLPIHRNNGIGLWPKFKKVIEENENK